MLNDKIEKLAYNIRGYFIIKKDMISDTQVLLALALAIIPSLLAVRLGTSLNNS
jgi:photosystem I reaction center subunit XII